MRAALVDTAATILAVLIGVLVCVLVLIALPVVFVRKLVERP